MTRVCQGYEGHECEVDISGRHPNARRCPDCAVKSSNATAKRRADEINLRKAYQYDAREVYPVRVVSC